MDTVNDGEGGHLLKDYPWLTTKLAVVGKLQVTSTVSICIQCRLAQVLTTTALDAMVLLQHARIRLYRHPLANDFRVVRCINVLVVFRTYGLL